MAPFNENEFTSKCNELSDKAISGSGSVYELYQRNLSCSIDSLLNSLPLEHKEKAIEIARNEFDYMSKEEIEEAISQDYEDGYCSHGLPFDCCPVGCGDI